MQMSQQQIRVEEGIIPQNNQNLEKLVDSHPFTHQLDVVLTSSEERARSLALLETSYYRTKITFSELFLAFSAASSASTALTLGSPASDVWCLDTLGILSLSLTTETYGRLGTEVGTRVGTGRGKFRFLVKLDLNDRTSPLSVRTRECLNRWDIQRAAEGENGWDVLLSVRYVLGAPRPEAKYNVRAFLQTTVNSHIPSHILPAIKSDNAQDLAGLFEWVGLASVGSQRLHVDDTVNSYAASYEPPSGSSVGKILHLRWSGFLAPAFVNSVLQEVLMGSDGVRAISALSVDAPVSYISSSGASQDGENVWTMIISEAEVHGSASRQTSWVLAKSKK